MVREKNNCCGCATPTYPCLGDSCPLRHTKALICDECKSEVNRLYEYEGRQLCEECLLKQFTTIE